MIGGDFGEGTETNPEVIYKLCSITLKATAVIQSFQLL